MKPYCKRVLGGLVAAVVISGVLAAAGCGSSNSQPTPPPSRDPKGYKVLTKDQQAWVINHGDATTQAILAAGWQPAWLELPSPGSGTALTFGRCPQTDSPQQCFDRNWSFDRPWIYRSLDESESTKDYDVMIRDLRFIPKLPVEEANSDYLCDAPDNVALTPASISGVPAAVKKDGPKRGSNDNFTVTSAGIAWDCAYRY